MDPARTVLVASDAHLGSTSPEQSGAFLTWLAQASDATDHIVLNGDVFDFWFEYAWGTTRGHEVALAELRVIVDGGTRVTIMGGNHDWWGGRYLREEVGVEFLQDPIVTDLAGHRTWLGHGDGLGRGDLGYRVMRPVLRGRFTRWAFGSLPPAVGDRIARGVSKTEERWRPPGPAEEASAARLRGWALDHLERSRDIDLILLGHCHIPSVDEPEPGRWYINSGDWVYHRSYVVLEEGREPRLEHWDGAIR